MLKLRWKWPLSPSAMGQNRTARADLPSLPAATTARRMRRSQHRKAMQLPMKPQALFSGTKDQLLHPPIGGFSGIDQIFRRAGERMRAGELLQLAS